VSLEPGEAGDEKLDLFKGHVNKHGKERNPMVSRGIAREASSKFQTSMEGEGSKVGNEEETLGLTTGPWLFPRLRQLRRRRSRGWKKEQA
jgi:hypothetical protein